MAPVLDGKLVEKINDYIAKNNVMVFSKSTCPYCKKVKDLFTSLKVDYFALDLDKIDDGPAIQDELQKMTGQRTVPNSFIGGTHLGGCDKTMEALKTGRLMELVKAGLPSVPVGDDTSLESYDYDFVVIGGGSGGLAAAKEAAALGVKVACLDFVKPSPHGTTWGLGGTCVNVGCIPKKLMHQAALLGHGLGDAAAFGWKTNNEMVHDWEKLVTSIQDHIGSLNWGYRVELRQKQVTYINAYAQFVGPHKIQCTDKKGEVKTLTGRHFLLATGGRPRYPNIPNADLAISSDDLFSLPSSPGRTLVVGASYVALECAGFLASLEYDVTVMVRSILLRGFDQQMAELIGQYMGNHRVKFIRPCVPTKLEKVDGKLIRVTARMQDSDTEVVDVYDTVLFAVGRDPCTANLGLEKIGVNTNAKTGYIVPTDGAEQTSCPYVYAVGDILEGKPELTPLAIQAGKLLARRLFAASTIQCDYENVPTTVFTPLEYGCIGLAEEDAILKYGENDIEVYHSNFRPLEWTVPGRDDPCYAKLICVKSLNEKIVGLHVLGPNAGEITQGFTLGLKLGATKQHFDETIGIHPTCAEVFTTLDITKSSGQEVKQSGC